MKTVIALLLKLLGPLGRLLGSFVLRMGSAEIRRLAPIVEQQMAALLGDATLSGAQKAEKVVVGVKAYFADLGVRVKSTDVLNLIQIIYTDWLKTGRVQE